MLHKFGLNTRFPLTSAFSLSAVMAAMAAIAPSAQAHTCLPTATGTPSGSPPTCSQYFGAGATFPRLFYRLFYDYYGIAIPTGTGEPGATGIQPLNPAGSPKNKNQQINYCGTSSRNGREIFIGIPTTSATSASCSYATANTISSDVSIGTAFAPFPTNTAGVTPLFAGTDAPLSATEISSYISTKLAAPPGAGRGNPIQVPTVFGAIDVINNPALGSLNITTAQLCGIFDGSITSINSIPITVVISDGSDTTTAFTTYLAAVCPTLPAYQGGNPPYYIPAGTDTFPPPPFSRPDFNRLNGNAGVAGRVAALTNGVGYAQANLGSPYATTALDPVMGTTNPAPLLASLQNPSASVQTFIFPTSTTVQRRLTGISLTQNLTILVF
jgi:phosphate transport system substrate-binding protein